MSILQTTHLTKKYGKEPNIVKALDDVNILIEQGEFVAVVGTSGSGKSTLLNMLGGLDRPSGGSVKENYILNGSFDAEKFAKGMYCLAICPSTDPSDTLPTYSVGEKVQIDDREFEVMAVVRPLQPMVANVSQLRVE